LIGLIGSVGASADTPDNCVYAQGFCRNGSSLCEKYKIKLNAAHVVCPGVNAVAEVPDNCESAQAFCRAGSSLCEKYKQQYNSAGVICPGVNTQSTTTIGGASALSSSASSAGADGSHASTDTVKSRVGDILAKVQIECDTLHGYKTFGSQVKCVKEGIRASPDLSATIISGDLQLYTLTADNLVDEVARKSITPSAARVELQKAFLEFRDRVNRQNAEVSAKEDAARLQAQQAEASAQAAHEQEIQRLIVAQAAAEAAHTAAEAEQRELYSHQEESVAFCVSEANQRLAANPQYAWTLFGLGIFPTSEGARTFRNVDRLCANDNYWYKQVPPPQKIITCSQSPGWGGVNCTEQ